MKHTPVNEDGRHQVRNISSVHTLQCRLFVAEYRKVTVRQLITMVDTAEHNIRRMNIELRHCSGNE